MYEVKLRDPNRDPLNVHRQQHRGHFAKDTQRSPRAQLTVTGMTIMAGKPSFLYILLAETLQAMNPRFLQRARTLS